MPTGVVLSEDWLKCHSKSYRKVRNATLVFLKTQRSHLKAHFSHWLPASTGLALLPAPASELCLLSPALPQWTVFSITPLTWHKASSGVIQLAASGRDRRTIWQSRRPWRSEFCIPTSQNSSTKHPQGLQQTHICALEACLHFQKKQSNIQNLLSPAQATSSK